MDVVYYCRDGENEELRYSIRSVVKNLKHDNLWVVGGKPEWYSGNYIHVPQNGSKYNNAKDNVLAILNSSEISDNFILMNDDFFVISKVNNLKTYHGGLLRQKIKHLKNKYGSSAYISMLQHTMRYLRRVGIPDPLDYALHIPFKVNKKKLSSVVNLGLSWRVAYGNIYKIGGEEVVIKNGFSYDVKVYVRDGMVDGVAENTITKKFLSSQDNSFELLLPRLQKMFPDPSPYEK